MQWKAYLDTNFLLKDNFSAAVQIADDVLDEENWPVHTIVVNMGQVVTQVPVHDRKTSGLVVYEMPSMIGWTTHEIREWVNENDKFTYRSPSTENLIAFIEE